MLQKGAIEQSLCERQREDGTSLHFTTQASTAETSAISHTSGNMPVHMDFQKPFETSSHQRLLNNFVIEQEERSLHCLITDYKSKD